MQGMPPGYGQGAPAEAAPAQPPVPPAPGMSIWICRHCGVVAPLEARACEVCKSLSTVITYYVILMK